MENSNKIVPPHLNAEVYRTDTTGTRTLSYLDYIRFHSDGTVLIGCSELSGRYWDGGANIYKKDAEEEDCINLERKNINLTSGTAVGCFVENSDRVFLCEDSGAVSIWTMQDDVWKQWDEELSVAEHDDAVLSLDCLQPGKEYVTTGADGSVKVWDIYDLICIRNYSSAHTMAVNTVSVRPKSQTTFATGSLDQFISLWDENVSQPVCDVLQNDCGIRCLKWLDENSLIFGDDAGTLSLLDVRMPGRSTKLTQFPAAVHQFEFQPESNKLAVCCDNKILTVCEITEETNVKVTHEDRNTHKGFIRGIAWDPNDTNVLYSVGWNGEFFKRNVN
ncbi:methylosome protein WDR77-like [Battus philenor]|uniref:methylosome protein WDR77-like n=1 Tax=Battus philenor TaxID=42288 RepID=UPI0035D01F79